MPENEGGIGGEVKKGESWIKKHLPLVLGGAVAVVVAVYLYLRNQASSSSTSTTPAAGLPPLGTGAPTTGTSGAPAPPPTSSAVTAWIDQTWTLTGNPTLDQLGQALTAAENAYGDALNTGNTSLAAALLPTLTAAQTAYNAAVAAVTNPVTPPPTTPPPTTPPPTTPPPPGTPPPTPPPPGTPTVSVTDIANWQAAYFTGAQTLAAWLAAAPSAFIGALNYDQQQAVYNYFNWAGQPGNPLHGASDTTIAADINAWLANPGSIPTVPPATPSQPSTPSVPGSGTPPSQASKPASGVTPYAQATQNIALVTPKLPSGLAKGIG